MKKRVLIMGAAGRDFHNFNVCYRDNPAYEVVAFTATQIPDIDGRKYPAGLCGQGYPDGIPIYSESELPELIIRYEVDDVVFSYSDVPHEYVMSKASWVLSCGANFILLGPDKTMLKSSKPVISVCAVRTGCGKSQTTRKVCGLLKNSGKKVVAVRHPMPYGDLTKQRVQRFATIEDLKTNKCTIEEMEEYEPHINSGIIVYAGVDYEAILRQAESEADIIVWDGGNNDTPFYCSDLEIVITDPHRPEHEILYHPGETNFRRADVIIINKVDTGDLESIEMIRRNVFEFNPSATVIEAASPIYIDNPGMIKDKTALVIEDGPTLTHGEMRYGAGYVAAQKFGAADIVDPRPFAVGEIEKTFENYEGIGNILPAMGYGPKQISDLEKTISRVDAEVVVIATPINLTRLIKINKPYVRVEYELQEIGRPTLETVLRDRGFI
ncbi:MAG: GTPase [Oligoflexia bacterium]|nr:GTPase [Oligoflexia bacterium]